MRALHQSAVATVAAFLFAVVAAKAELQPQLIQTKKIWDAAPHNAFTDLVRWQNTFYCAFREGQGHAGDLGKIRILLSADGEEWESAGLLSMDEYDLRDAALSVMPDGRLMVMGGAQQIIDGKHVTGTFVSFTRDGKDFSASHIVIPHGRWLWRVTWHGDSAYGVSYGGKSSRTHTELLHTKDGIKYDSATDKLLGEIGGWPTEARIRFGKDDTAYCLHRRDGNPSTAYFGSAKKPYKEWMWRDLGVKLGGPNFLQIPSGEWIAAGRLYDGETRTEVLLLDVDKAEIKSILRLPSGGDTSYPGMVWHDDRLWISYYASHEERTSIYLSQIRFSKSKEKRQR